MAFEQTRRFGSLWDDVKKLSEIVTEFNFATTQKTEREFEIALANVLMSHKKSFSQPFISQIDKETTVEGVYCFGKKHRPDMTFGDSGIAIEVKYVNESLDSFKNAIGQSYIYRLRYKYCFLILIVSESNEGIYKDIATGKEKDVEDIVKDLGERNIFTYILPAFKLTNIRKSAVFYNLGDI